MRGLCPEEDKIEMKSFNKIQARIPSREKEIHSRKDSCCQIWLILAGNYGLLPLPSTEYIFRKL